MRIPITIPKKKVPKTPSSIKVSFASATVQPEKAHISFSLFFFFLLSLAALFKVTNGLNLRQMQEIVSFDPY